MITHANPEFRTDINGLRAYAVLAVLLYHFGIPGIASGYAGVDVFFVISGYLMASLILGKMIIGSFSLKAFYFARLRRIFPALAVVCFVLIALGWFWLGPTDYATLGKHASSSLAFISNFIYRAEEGYFDAPSRDKWLLHTWSLAVEAQFYLLFPLLLILLKSRLNRSDRFIRNSLWGLAVGSFLLCYFNTESHPAFAFYLLPARAWELLAGSLAYMYSANLRLTNLQRRMMEYLGIAIVVLSMVGFSDVTAWPGYRAALPVLGTVLVLLAARQHTWLTGNALVQKIGDWSYSLYLWHWPVVVALYYLGVNKDPRWIIAGMGAALVLGACSYAFVEQPTRRWAKRWPNPEFVRVAACTALALILCSISITFAKGVEGRVSEAAKIADREINNRKNFRIGCGFDTRRGELTPCYVDKTEPVRYVLWGDSHVGSIASALRDTVNKGIVLYSHACPTLFDVEIHSKDLKNRCRDFNEAALQQIRELPADTRVIITNRYAVNLHGPNEGTIRRWGFVYYDLPDQGRGGDQEALYKDHVKASLCRIAEVRPVYVILPTPEFGFSVPRHQVRRLMRDPSTAELTMREDAYRARNAVVLQALHEAAESCKRITLVDPVPAYCEDGQCFATNYGRPLYIDDNHVSEFGNRRMMPIFAKYFADDLRTDWRERARLAPIGPKEMLYD